MPRFPGCEDLAGTDEEKRQCANQEMLKFIYQNVRYPAEARQKGIEGMAVVQFVVNTDGSLENIKLVRDIGGGAGEAAKDVVELMNTENKIWTPGVERGEEVKVQFTLPVRFKLEGQERFFENKSEFSLNAVNIPQGTVVVRGGGQKLTEGKDYEIDYQIGRIKILDETYVKEGVPIRVSFESPEEKVTLPKGKAIDEVVVVGFGEKSETTIPDENKLHYVIYTINDSDEAKVAITEYNKTYFISSRLRVSSMVLNEAEKVHVILVRKFDNANKATAYVANAVKNIDDYLSKKEFKFDMLVVTQKIYREIVQNKSIEKHKSLGDINSVIKRMRYSRDSPIYKAINPIRDQFQGSFPLTIVNGNKYERHSVFFGEIDVTEDQIKTVNYLEPSAAKKKYGEIAFHGALEIELDNVTERELEKIGKIITPGSQVLSIKEKEEVFKVVEQMPRFPDCEDKCTGADATEDCHKEELLHFIYSHLRYPEEAKDAGIEGVSVVQFVIDKTGTVIEPKVVRDIGGGTAKEVLYVVELMNNLTKKWTPGYQRGEAVNVLYTLPVRFKLDASEPNDNAGKQIELDNLELEKQPLYILNGEIYTEDFRNLDPDDIETLQIIKGQEAIDKYGDEGVNGVVEITTKGRNIRSNIIRDSKTNRKTIIEKITPNGIANTNPLKLVVVDGKAIGLENKVSLNFRSNKVYIEELEPKIAVKRFGQKAKHGAILYKPVGDIEIEYDVIPDNINLNPIEDDINKAIHNFELKQNRPNPVEASTIIGFNLPVASRVQLTFYNVAGMKIMTHSENYEEGYNEVTVTKSDLNYTGILYYTMEAGEFKSTRKMTILD